MGESGYMDRTGQVFGPDPLGRFAFRSIEDGRWTDVVTRKRNGRHLSDPEGEAQLRGVVVNVNSESADAAGAERLTNMTRPAGVEPWEYKIISATFGSSLESTLNSYGNAGWEVVSISAASGTWTVTGNKLFALLKRRGAAAP